eukprot:TRINITY_DN20019_c0_g1_i1.p1 TRINITY_DN20019_c0_g1~~TRINITY_DN20019_c0_g1_i1.p1  ORF type:complete len:2554 (+),score=732.65 TRINITY_DN20019_c0_g1_i1:75-7736(+)
MPPTVQIGPRTTPVMLAVSSPGGHMSAESMSPMAKLERSNDRRRRLSEAQHERAAALALLKICGADAVFHDAWVCALSHGPQLRQERLSEAGWAGFLRKAGLLGDPEARAGQHVPAAAGVFVPPAVDVTAAREIYGDVFWDAADGTELAAGAKKPGSGEPLAPAPALDFPAFAAALVHVARQAYASAEDGEMAMRDLADKTLLPYKQREQVGAGCDWDTLSSSFEFGRILWAHEDPLHKVVASYTDDKGMNTQSFQRFGMEFGLVPTVCSNAGMIRAVTAVLEEGQTDLLGPRQLLRALTLLAADADPVSLVPDGGLPPSTMIGRLDAFMHAHFLRGYEAAMPAGPRVQHGDPPPPRIRQVIPAEVQVQGGEARLRGDNLGGLGIGVWVRWDWGDDMTETIEPEIDPADPFAVAREGELQTVMPPLPEQAELSADAADVDDQADGGLHVVRLHRRAGRVAVFNCGAHAAAASSSGWSGGCSVMAVRRDPPFELPPDLSSFLRQLHDAAARGRASRPNVMSPNRRRGSLAATSGRGGVSEAQWRLLCSKFGLPDPELTAFCAAADCAGGAALLDFAAFVDALLRAVCQQSVTTPTASPRNVPAPAAPTPEEQRDVVAQLKVHFLPSEESTYEEALQNFERGKDKDTPDAPELGPRRSPPEPLMSPDASARRTSGGPASNRALQGHLLAKLRRASCVIDQLRQETADTAGPLLESVDVVPDTPVSAGQDLNASQGRTAPNTHRGSTFCVDAFSPGGRAARLAARESVLSPKGASAPQLASPRPGQRRTTIRTSRGSIAPTQQQWEGRFEELTDLVSCLAEEVCALSADDNSLLTQMVEARDRAALASLSSKTKDAALARARAAQSKATKQMQMVMDQVKQDLQRRDEMLASWADVSKSTTRTVQEIEQWCSMLVNQVCDETAARNAARSSMVSMVSPTAAGGHSYSGHFAATPRRQAGPGVFQGGAFSRELTAGDQRSSVGGASAGEHGISRIYMKQIKELTGHLLERLREMQRLSVLGKSKDKVDAAAARMQELGRIEFEPVDPAGAIRQIQEYGRDMHEKIRAEQNRNITEMVKAKLDTAVRIREGQIASEARACQERLQNEIQVLTKKLEYAAADKQKELAEAQKQAELLNDENVALHEKLQAAEAKLAHERQQRQRATDQQRHAVQEQMAQHRNAAGSSAAIARLRSDISQLQMDISKRDDMLQSAHEKAAELERELEASRKLAGQREAELRDRVRVLEEDLNSPRQGDGERQRFGRRQSNSLSRASIRGSPRRRGSTRRASLGWASGASDCPTGMSGSPRDRRASVGSAQRSGVSDAEYDPGALAADPEMYAHLLAEHRKEAAILRRILVLKGRVAAGEESAGKEMSELELQLEELRCRLRLRRIGEPDTAGEFKHQIESGEVISLKSQMAAMREHAKAEADRMGEEITQLRSNLAARQAEWDRLRANVAPLRAELEEVRLRLAESEATRVHLAGRLGEAAGQLPDPVPAPEVLIELRNWRLGLVDCATQTMQPAYTAPAPPAEPQRPTTAAPLSALSSGRPYSAGRSARSAIETPRLSSPHVLALASPRDDPAEAEDGLNDEEHVAGHIVAQRFGMPNTVQDWQQKVRPAVANYLSTLQRSPTGGRLDHQDPAEARRLEWAARILDSRWQRDPNYSPPPSAWSPDGDAQMQRSRSGAGKSDPGGRLPPLHSSSSVRPHTAQSPAQARARVSQDSTGSMCFGKWLPCELVLTCDSELLPQRRASGASRRSSAADVGEMRVLTLRELQTATDYLRHRPRVWALQRVAEAPPFAAGTPHLSERRGSSARQERPVVERRDSGQQCDLPPIYVAAAAAATQSSEPPAPWSSREEKGLPSPVGPRDAVQVAEGMRGALRHVRSWLSRIRATLAAEVDYMVQAAREASRLVQALGRRAWQGERMVLTKADAEELMQEAVADPDGSLRRSTELPTAGSLQDSWVYQKCRDVVASEFLFLKQVANVDVKCRRAKFRHTLRRIGIEVRLRRLRRQRAAVEARVGSSAAFPTWMGTWEARLQADLQERRVVIARFVTRMADDRQRLGAMLDAHSIAHTLLYPSEPDEVDLESSTAVRAGAQQAAEARQLLAHPRDQLPEELQQEQDKLVQQLLSGVRALRNWVSVEAHNLVVQEAEDYCSDLRAQVAALVRRLCDEQPLHRPTFKLKVTGRPAPLHDKSAEEEKGAEKGKGEGEGAASGSGEAPWLTQDVLRTLATHLESGEDADLPGLLKVAAYDSTGGLHGKLRLAGNLAGAAVQGSVERLKRSREGRQPDADTGAALQLFTSCRKPRGPAKVYRRRIVVRDDDPDPEPDLDRWWQATTEGPSPFQSAEPPPPALPAPPAPPPPPKQPAGASPPGHPASAAVAARRRTTLLRRQPRSAPSGSGGIGDLLLEPARENMQLAADAWRRLVPQPPPSMQAPRAVPASSQAPRPQPPMPCAPASVAVPLPAEPPPGAHPRATARGGTQWSNLGSATGGVGVSGRSEAGTAFKMIGPSRGVAAPRPAAVGCIDRLIRSHTAKAAQARAAADRAVRGALRGSAN